ncbi:hypothetical protein [Aliarcobacter butzleri]|uniref:hypothetical protein n=1 Tax=Aliarcobacter butzleri TaxID=28197 RepID=UPI0024DEE8D8|nr:hypothetical protein [Aliarcobacter butzleri]MDK2047762.1 hypothetical protein [Aliarcobacter butzleri]MDN5060568.1 hypothetical protein [Aliarcobacter butzleri]
MKKCNACNKDIGQNAVVCPNCGQKIMSDGAKYIGAILFFVGLALLVESWFK